MKYESKLSSMGFDHGQGGRHPCLPTSYRNRVMNDPGELLG